MNKSIIMLALLLFAPAFAMLNPATVYCEAMGYAHRVEATEYGERGICVVEGNPIEEWEFLSGKAGQEHSYCAREGYGVEIVSGAYCEKFLLESCMACVLQDGRKVEMTELMGLDFSETTCGDSLCNFPETYTGCPQDCPSGGKDEYCDGMQDGKCDTDCRRGEDADCNALQPGVVWAAAGLACLIILAAVIWKFFMARK